MLSSPVAVLSCPVAPVKFPVAVLSSPVAAINDAISASLDVICPDKAPFGNVSIFTDGLVCPLICTDGFVCPLTVTFITAILCGSYIFNNSYRSSQ